MVSVRHKGTVRGGTRERAPRKGGGAAALPAHRFSAAFLRKPPQPCRSGGWQSAVIFATIPRPFSSNPYQLSMLYDAIPAHFDCTIHQFFSHFVASDCQ
jgi:hypothetical protein